MTIPGMVAAEDQTSMAARDALLQHLKTPLRQRSRGRLGELTAWLIKAIGSRLALIVIGTVVWWLFLLFMLGWFTKGSALQAGWIVLKLIGKATSALVTWALGSILPGAVPDWAMHVVEASVAFLALVTTAYCVGWVIKWAVILAGRWWFGERWAIAEAWWRSPIYGENLRDGLKAASGLAVVWLVIVLAFELPVLSYPILWSVFGLIELLMLGTALSELKWLPGFLRAGDQQLAMSILENDWDRARRRQAEIDEEIERRIAQAT